jgi:hypothetical protein
MDVADKSLYAANNGWIEAICGQHNQQRVRWKSSETVIVGSFIDVLYFPDRRLFEAYGLGGAAAVTGAGGWPFAHVLTVSTTDTEADYSTIAAAITAATAGDVILLDAETYTGAVTLNKNVTLKGSAQGDTILTLSASGTTLTVSTAGAVVENLTVLNTRATGTNKAVAITADCRLRNVIASSTGAATTNYGIDVSAATVDLINCEASASGSTNKIALNLVSSAVVSAYLCTFNGATYDVLTDTSTINLHSSILTNGILLNSASTERVTPVHTKAIAVEFFSKFSGLSDSDFSSTISSKSGSTLTYGAVTTGAENNLVNDGTGYAAKMLLWNTTRGEYLLIDNTNIATDVITFTTAVPASWVATDVVTIRSQTNTSNPVAGVYFTDWEVDSNISAWARAVELRCWHQDSGAGARVWFHPYKANSDAERDTVTMPTAGGVMNQLFTTIQLTSRRFCVAWDATGAGTLNISARLKGERTG